MIIRLVDAFTDPVFGSLIDRTEGIGSYDG